MQTRKQARLLRKDPPGVGQLADHILADQRAHELRASHIGHKAPLALDEAQPGPGRNVSQVGAERELKTAAECDAVNRGNHRDRHLSPCPDDVLDILAMP